jgi:hypothetical protein
MPRPRNAEPSRRVDIHLPESLHAQLSLVLFSPVEGRVPHGEWSRFFCTLAREALARVAAASPPPPEPFQ